MGFTSIALVAAACACAMAMHYFDRRLQRYRPSDVPASAFRFVPIRWTNERLYAAPGQFYRRRVIQAWILTIVLAILAMIAIRLAA